MTPDQIKDLITHATYPLVLKTRGGVTYNLAGPGNVFISDAYPTALVLVMKGQGIRLLGMSAIDSIQTEHELIPF
jgi:hypothetical protein